MAGSIALNNIGVVSVSGAVPITLPDVRIHGKVEQEQGAGQPNVVLYDFDGGDLADADGQGTSLWRLISSLSANQTELANVLATLDSGMLAKVFAGVG